MVLKNYFSYIPAVHKAKEKSQEYWQWSKRNRDGTLKFKDRVIRFVKGIEFLIGLACTICVLHMGFEATQEQSMAFTRRFLIMILFWVVFIEPIKVSFFAFK